MNEDEKKAIEIVKEIKDIRGMRQDVEGENEDLWALDTLINLIDKQQEEIKARLEEIDSLYKMMSAKDDIINFKDDEIKYLEGKLEQYVDTPEFEEKYISKDKIKEQIRMVEETKRKGKGIDNYSMHYCIMRLKELLGE